VFSRLSWRDVLIFSCRFEGAEHGGAGWQRTNEKWIHEKVSQLMCSMGLETNQPLLVNHKALCFFLARIVTHFTVSGLVVVDTNPVLEQNSLKQSSPAFFELFARAGRRSGNDLARVGELCTSVGHAGEQ
jgi:hypothetical protein